MRFLRFSRRLKPIQQAETAECGLACLAMVLSGYQTSTELDRLRTMTPVGSRGWTLQELIAAARQHALDTRALRLSLRDLRRLRCPAILHWDQCHFVVLERTSRRHLVILDPAVGRRRLETDEVSQHFTGVALECWPSAHFKPHNSRSALRYRDLLTQLHGVWGSFAYLLLLSLCVTGLLLVAPFYTQLVIDHALASGDADLLTILAVAFGLLALVSALVEALRSWVIGLLASRLNLVWSVGLFQHLLVLPFDYFNRRSVGDIQSRFRSLDALRALFTTQLVEAIVDSITVVAALIIMAVYSGPMLVVLLVGFGIATIVKLSLVNALRSATEELVSADAARDAVFLNALRSVVSIKNFAQEGRRVECFADRVEQTVESTLRVARLSILGRCLSNATTGLQMVLLIWVGAHAVLGGVMSIGMLVAFLSYARHFELRSGRLVDRLIMFHIGTVHLDRLAGITHQKPEFFSSRSERLVVGKAASLQVRKLRFRYDDASRVLFEDLSFSIEAGANFVISGESGSGKSSLLKILCGLLLPSSGDVLVEHTKLTQQRLHAYRRGIAVVMQNDTLFPGTLKDNLTLGQSIETRTLWRTLESVCAAEFVSKLPMGLHSRVGELGDLLSGGERQRLLLARALCRAPGILFLDEASNQLATEMRLEIEGMLAGLSMTRISVTHCASTLALADAHLHLDRVRTK